MEKLSYLFFIVTLFSNCTQQTPKKDYPIQPISSQEVELTDNFWSKRIATNRDVTIPYCFEKCEETNRISNFEVAGGLKEGTFEGIRFNDSDVFKIMEGAAYSIQQKYDPKLDKYLDDLIAKIAAAQEEDGYLYTIRTIKGDSAMTRSEGNERWKEVRNHSHELYNVGHMYEAAVAHFQATGKTNFLDVAIKNADLINSIYGPDKRHDAPGHQEIEIGLAKLYQTTGEKKYLDLAQFFLDERGKSDIRDYRSTNKWENGSYWQDHKPVVEQTEAVGHAVRAVYMYSGMADVAALTGNQQYIDAINTIWENVVGKKYYITGGIGAMYEGEAFGENYQLPNHAYNETCAAIANVFWNHRMFLMKGESKYIDVLERTLYNGMLSGISFEGNTFFYPNVLEFDGVNKFNQGDFTRKPWFNCSCCPSNISRFIPAVPSYMYAQSGKDIYANLFMDSKTNFIIDKNNFTIEQETKYPWAGSVKFKISTKNTVDFNFKIRIPGWANNQPVPSDLYSYLNESQKQVHLFFNNKPVDIETSNGYISIQKNWKEGDVVELVLPMEVRKVVPHENVKEIAGKIAIERGPIVYCAEQVDNPDGVLNKTVSLETQFKSNFESKTLDGVVKLESEEGLKMVPYYSWSHRELGEMAVWFRME
ncbi:MAG: glycoside hydrolase family 127 protein [Bacteroidetes bacterium]|nr:glycoside hydrolase family 127 protein [Bacteroidota bacterium]